MVVTELGKCRLVSVQNYCVILNAQQYYEVGAASFHTYSCLAARRSENNPIPVVT